MFSTDPAARAGVHQRPAPARRLPRREPRHPGPRHGTDDHPAPPPAPTDGGITRKSTRLSLLLGARPTHRANGLLHAPPDFGPSATYLRLPDRRAPVPRPGFLPGIVTPDDGVSDADACPTARSRLAARRIRRHRQPVPEAQAADAPAVPRAVARGIGLRPADVHAQEPGEIRSADARRHGRLQRPQAGGGYDNPAAQGLLQDPRLRPRRRLSGRGQDGLPQARSRAPPRPQAPATRRPQPGSSRITDAYKSWRPRSATVLRPLLQALIRGTGATDHPAPADVPGRQPPAGRPGRHLDRDPPQPPRGPAVVIIIATGTGGKQPNGATTPPAAGTTATPSTPKS